MYAVNAKMYCVINVEICNVCIRKVTM